MPNIIGGPGGSIDQGGGSVKPPVGEPRPAVRQTAPGIADGAPVEGLVAGREGETYQVRIGGRLLNARSTVNLFVGQRFRAVWDASTTPPTLRLSRSDADVLARFTGRNRQIAMEFLARGLPVKDEAMLGVRREWIRQGGDMSKLGVLAELWARGAAMSEGNVALLSWYAELSPERAALIWKKIRERLRAREHKSGADLLAALKGGDEDEETARFLQAHALAGKPARKGVNPSALSIGAWWPAGEDDGEPVMASVAFSADERRGKQIFWMSFHMDGKRIGPAHGQVMTDGRALSASVKLSDSEQVAALRDELPALREDLLEIDMPVQYLGVSEYRASGVRPARKRRVDMEA